MTLNAIDFGFYTLLIEILATILQTNHRVYTANVNDFDTQLKVTHLGNSTDLKRAVKLIFNYMHNSEDAQKHFP